MGARLAWLSSFYFFPLFFLKVWENTCMFKFLMFAFCLIFLNTWNISVCKSAFCQLSNSFSLYIGHPFSFCFYFSLLNNFFLLSSPLCISTLHFPAPHSHSIFYLCDLSIFSVHFLSLFSRKSILSDFSLYFFSILSLVFLHFLSPLFHSLSTLWQFALCTLY